MTRKEFITVAIAFCALVAAQMIATHARLLLTEVPWLDEVHTGILVTEPDSAKFKASVSNECVDGNFPVYYEILRAFHVRSLPAIRMFSLAGGIAGMLGIYVLLRGSFTMLESAVGVLAVWSAPIVIFHSFQARFYVPWFTAVIWFAVAMRWTKTARSPWLAAIAVAITSILAATLHLLGLPAIGLIVLAEILADSRPMKTRIISALPALAGAIAVAMFIPLVMAQGRSFQIKTWLVGNPIRLLYSTITGLIPGVAMTVLVLGMFVAAWMRARCEQDKREVRLAPLAGISSLILFPIVLLVLTILLQPLLLTRYALICMAPLAAAAAYAASRMNKPVALAVCLALAAETGAEMSRRVRDAVGDGQKLDALVSSIRAEPRETVLFESRHQLFPVVWVARDLVDRCAYADFQPGPNQLDPVVEGFERDLSKKFERVFGWPRVMAWEKITRLDRFMLVAMDEDDERIARRFAPCKLRRIGPQEYQVTRD